MRGSFVHRALDCRCGHRACALRRLEAMRERDRAGAWHGRSPRASTGFRLRVDAGSANDAVRPFAPRSGPARTEQPASRLTISINVRSFSPAKLRARGSTSLGVKWDRNGSPRTSRGRGSR